MDNELTILDNFEKAKALITEVDLFGAIDILNKAEALRIYAAKAQKGLEVQNQCAELKIRAERRAGEMLREMDLKAGNPQWLHDETIASQPPPKLEDLGISKVQSHRWQFEASVPVEKFERHIEQIKAKALSELTSISIIRLAKDTKRQDTLLQNQSLIKSTIPIPNGKFKAILLDPPWDWGDEGDISQMGRGNPIFGTMPIEKIRELPIIEIAEPDSHLYLCITNRSLPKGFKLLEDWGFRYITLLTWCKPSIGMGNYFRGQTEHIIFGVKGNLPLLSKDVGTWFMANRGNNHSSKPRELYTIIEKCSPGPWIELFARKERPGWACWGAEVGTGNS